MASGKLKRYNGVSWDQLFVDPSSHNHVISEVVGLQDSLNARLTDAPSDGKTYARKNTAWVETSTSAHSHTESDITDLDKYTQQEVDDALALKSDVHAHPFASDTHNHDLDYKDIAYVPSWGEITSKPATFTPSTHNHDTSYRGATWVPSWTDVTGKPTTFTPSTHNHDGDYAPPHSHPYASDVHNHDADYKGIGYVPSWAEITGKPSTFTPATHNHDADYKDISYVPSWAEITGKPSTYTPSTHTHTGVYEPVHSHPYVNLDGSSTIVKTTSGDALRIEALPTESDISIHLGLAGESNSFKLKYWGTGAGNTNDFSIESSSATLFRSHQDGIVNFPNGLQKGGANVIVEGDSRLTDARTPLTHNHDGVYRPISYVPSWAEITGKPSTFTPSAHSQAISTITGLQTALDGKVDDSQVLTNVPAGALFTDTVYSLTKAKVEAVLTGAITTHTHASDNTWRGVIDNLTSTSTSDSLTANQGRVLKGLIDAINTLLLSDTTTLDTLQEIVDYIETNRSTLDTLAISNITGLQSALDGKAAVHSHPYAATVHTHSDYLKYDPDGDGIVIAYDDSNPNINGQSVGGGHIFGADGNVSNGYLAAKVMFAEGISHSVSGYYTGSLSRSTGGTGNKIADSSGNLFAQGVVTIGSAVLTYNGTDNAIDITFV